MGCGSSSVEPAGQLPDATAAKPPAPVPEVATPICRAVPLSETSINLIRQQQMVRENSAFSPDSDVSEALDDPWAPTFAVSTSQLSHAHPVDNCRPPSSENSAARHIQAVYRGHRSRMGHVVGEGPASQPRERKVINESDRAAVRIQAQFRGFKTRQRRAETEAVKNKGRSSLETPDKMAPLTYSNGVPRFEDLTELENAPVQQKMEFVFTIFDRNGNGLLDREEIAAIIGEGCSPATVDAVLVDMAGEIGARRGTVSVQDFVAYTHTRPELVDTFTQHARFMVASHNNSKVTRQ